MGVVICALLALGCFVLLTVVLRRRAMGPRARPVGVVLVLAAFGSLFVGVLMADPPRWLPYLAWSVAGVAVALLRHAPVLPARDRG